MSKFDAWINIQNNFINMKMFFLFPCQTLFFILIKVGSIYSCTCRCEVSFHSLPRNNALSQLPAVVIILTFYIESMLEIVYSTAVRSPRVKLLYKFTQYCGGQLVAGSFDCKNLFIFSLFYVIPIFTLLILISIFIKACYTVQSTHDTLLN